MGYIYFIQDLTNQAIKIGASEDPEAQFQRFQAATVAELVLLRHVKVPDCFQTERRLHVRFSASRIRGGWFRAEPNLLEFAVSGDVTAFSVQPTVTGILDKIPDQDVRFTLKELGEKTGLSVRTIRYYIANNTMPGPIGMGPGAHYSQRHIEAIREILVLKDAGYSLEDIAAGIRLDKPTVKAVPVETVRYKIGNYLEVHIQKDLPPIRKRQVLDAVAWLEDRFAVMNGDNETNERKEG